MTDTRFIFNEPNDDTVDAEYVLLTNMSITIQCAPYAGGYAVNEHGGEGESFWLRDHGIFRRLSDAKAKALEVAKATA